VDEHAAVLDLQALLTGKQVADYTNRTINVIVNWRNRGILPIATNPETGEEIRDGRGRPMYRLIDAVRADHRTHAGARKMADTLLRAAA